MVILSHPGFYNVSALRGTGLYILSWRYACDLMPGWPAGNP